MSNSLAPAAVVVGVGPGIGAAVAARLARDGAKVFGLARTAESLSAAAGAVAAAGGVFAGQLGDAADDGAVARLVGSSDIGTLVYNAAALRANRARDVSATELTETLAVDVVGALAAVQAV